MPGRYHLVRVKNHVVAVQRLAALNRNVVQLGLHVVSLRQEPPIKPGTKDPYEPPKC